VIGNFWTRAPVRFGIRPQAALLAVVPLVALLVLLALGSLAMRETERGAATTDRLVDRVSQSERIIESFTRINASLRAYEKSRHPADLVPADTIREHLPDQEREIERSVAGDALLSARASAFAASVNAATAIVRQYEAALRRNDSAGIQHVTNLAAAQRVSQRLETTYVSFNQAAQHRMLSGLTARRSSLRRVELVLVIVALAGIALTILVAVLFGMRIVSRLRRLGDNARRLADGTPTIPEAGNDEIAELDALYRVMADRIQTQSREHEEALVELQRERDSAAMLQHALLPDLVPIDGLHIDSAYVTPAEGAQIGGDWFDVFSLSSRLVGLSVGDVTGHGLRAAATMGYLRQSIRTVARLDPNEPGIVMERVNRVVCEESGGIATAFFATFDRETGILRYAIAGHAPPIMIGRDGEVSLLAGGGTLLGLDGAMRFASFERTLTPGDGLVLYTDGIVEVERDYLQGMRDLEDAIRAEFRAPSEHPAQAIQNRVFADRSPRDDSAVLVLGVTALMAVDTPSGTTWNFDARNQMAAWRAKGELLAGLRALGPDQPDLAVAEMVFGELLSNVVRHTPGPARVSFRIEDGHVVLAFEDDGAPFPLRSLHERTAPHADGDAESGRGLFMITTLCKRITIEPLAHGKRFSVVLPRAELADVPPLQERSFSL